jgi:hypothetical protein
MNRLESKNTTKELKDNFKQERNNLISLSKNYDNQMNNYGNNLNSQQIEVEKYFFNDLPIEQMSANKLPIPYTDPSKNNQKIKSLSEIGSYTNFIPIPEDTRNKDYEVNNSSIEGKKEITFNNVYDENHPKKMYLNNDNYRNELLENQRTIIKNTTVNLNKLNEFNSTFNSNNNLYIAEIGDKRKLSNIIYDSINRSYQNLSNKINEYQIYHILNSLDINNNKWSKNNTVKFVEEFQKIINTEKDEIPNNDNIIQENRLFERNTKEIDYYITIDSNDRDKEKWENANFYEIVFGPTNDQGKNKGYINQSFNNVQTVELIEAIIPKNTKNGTNYNTLPYILLEIPELGSVYQGTNDNLRKTFSQLIFDTTVGNYRYCSFSDQTKVKKIFNPRIALNKLTIKFIKPNGELYNFGEYIEINEEQENKDIIPNNILTFKITCIQRSLDSMFLNHKN